MKDELGDRIKKNYENRTRILLPRRTYTIIRIDGRSFSNYTKNLVRPFDVGLIDDMNTTAEYLCKHIQGAKIGFVQSDEISILMTDFDKLQTDAWFDGNIQKIVSIASSMTTSKFNQLRWMRYVNERFNRGDENDPVSWEWFEGVRKLKLAEFDARTFTIPSKSEVMNSFIWRQKDCVRNSIQSVGQSLYSHSELNNKNTSNIQEMIFQKGQNWNDYDPMLKRGRLVFKKEYKIDGILRSCWVTSECPEFSKNPQFLDQLIPDLP